MRPPNLTPQQRAEFRQLMEKRLAENPDRYPALRRVMKGERPGIDWNFILQGVFIAAALAIPALVALGLALHHKG